MNEYIKIIKEEIDVIDDELEKIEEAFKNDKLEDYELQFLKEAKFMWKKKLDSNEKIIREARKKARKSNQVIKKKYP